MRTKRTTISLLGQYARFATTGVLNTAVDFSVLNVLLFASSAISQGGMKHAWYVAFKTVSFLAAVANSWFLNKNWVFRDSASSARAGTKKEGLLFLGVSLFGFAMNVTASYIVFASLSAAGLWSETVNANIGAVAGTALTQVSNFAGYRLLIFKPRHEPHIPLGYHPRLQGRKAHRSDPA